MKLATSSYTWGKLKNIEAAESMLDDMVEVGLKHLSVEPSELPQEIIDNPFPFIDLAKERGIEIITLTGYSKELDVEMVRNYGVKLMWVVIEKDGFEDWLNESIGIAEKVLDLGVEVAIHHHLNGPVDTYDRILELFSRISQSNVQNLSLCLDPGHLTGAYGNVLQAIEDFKDKIGMVHITDYIHPPSGKSIVFEETFVDLGEGIVDYKPILENLNKIGYDGWYIIEAHYPMGNNTPIDTIRLNKDRFENVVNSLK